jgi:hypothetical protein
MSAMSDLSAMSAIQNPRVYNILLGCFFYLLFVCKYYTDTTEEKTKKPRDNLILSFFAILMTFLIDYWPSFRLSECDVWLSHVINAALRSMNTEYSLSLDCDINLTEWLDYITPSFYKNDFEFKSKFNKTYLQQFNPEDCCASIREGYLYLLGDDENVPFKPVQQLILRIKFLQQHVREILLAMFLAYYKHGLLSF